MKVIRDLTATEDAAFTYVAKLRSERVITTADQLLVSVIDGAIADIVNESRSKQSGQRALLASVATPEDLAVVDGVLDKYKATVGIVG